MNKTFNVNHILQAIAVFTIPLLTSYEHKDLCYDHSHNARIQVVFDWKNAPDATLGTMRLCLFPMDGSRSRAYEFTDCREGYIIIPTGRYRVLCINSGTESVFFHNIDLFNRFEAYAPDGVLNVGSSLAPRVEGTSTEHVIKSSDRLHSAHLDDVMIKLPNENQTVTLHPKLPVYRYWVTIANVSNLKHISSDDIPDAFSGISGGLLVGRNELTADPVTVPLGVSSDGNSVLTVDLLAFGQISSISPAYKLVIYVIMSDGSKNCYTFSMTRQVDGATDPRDIRIMLDGLPLPKPIVNGGNFHPTVDEWQNINVEVPMWFANCISFR